MALRWDVAVGGPQELHRTFTGIVWDVPVGIGGGRRPVANGHPTGALTLVASMHLEVSLCRGSTRRGSSGTFEMDIMADTQLAWTSRP